MRGTRPGQAGTQGVCLAAAQGCRVEVMRAPAKEDGVKYAMSSHVQDMPKLASSSHLTLSANAEHVRNASRSSGNAGRLSGRSARLPCQGCAGTSRGRRCRTKVAELPVSFTYHTTSAPDSITSRKAAMRRPVCTQPVRLGTIDLDVSLAASDGGVGLRTGGERMTGAAEQVGAPHHHQHLQQKPITHRL